MFKFLLEYNEYINNIENSNKELYIYNEILKRSKFGRLPIVEGLVFSFPLQKSVSILQRKFPELIINIQPDGDIYVENQPPQKLEKYLPLITNIGYFISTFTIDGQEWLKNYTVETEPIAFMLEAKYDYEVNIPTVLYHASPYKFKDKILKYGLSPRSGSKLANHPDRIYLTDDIRNALSFGNYLKTIDNNGWYENGYCIYSIIGGVSKLYSDVNFRQGGFYTTNNIKSEYIKLIKEVK